VAEYEPARLRSVLVVKMSSIGDVVQALPVATALRRWRPELRISWAVEEWVEPLLAEHPAIDRLISFPTMRWRSVGSRWAARFRDAVRRLREEPYDVAVDLQSLAKSSLVSLLSRAPVRIGHAWQREGARWVSRPVAHQPGVHAVEEYLACAQALGAPPTEVRFDLPVRESARNAANALLAGHGIVGGAPVVINPSAGRARKCWPAERWIEVAAGLAGAGDLVLVGTAAQMRRHRAIARSSGAEVCDLTGRTTLAELVALLERSALHVCHDSGSANIAAALGVPVVSVFGPTDPRRLAPYGQSHLALGGNALCGATCPVLCPYRRRCLDGVTAEEVVRTARAVLSDTPSAARAR
jgi:heptosyltransferase-1